MKKYFIIGILISLSVSLFSQESIRLISYNLLNFYNFTNYCTQENNSPEKKAKYLKTIISNQNPDIFAACEVGKANGNAQKTLNYILENSLNTNGETKWKAAAPIGKGSSLNALFYDKNKFTLIGQPLIPSDPRDINIYKLQYIDTQESEPIYINIIVAHLKAGSSDSDKLKRSKSATHIMNHLNMISDENIIITGDFNLYTAQEPCFQKLINPENPAKAFNDPINQIGNWHENQNYKNYHTQSTHAGYAGNSTCWVGGGLDDRFDFILISNAIKNGNKKIKYKHDSYLALGQDGQRFNNAINSPTNFSLPQDVINALFNMSDHLPVVAEFYFNSDSSIASESTDANFFANIVNPSSENFIFELKMDKARVITASIFNISGKKVFETKEEFMPNNIYKYNISNIPDGMYIINFTGEGITQSFRLIKN